MNWLERSTVGGETCTGRLTANERAAQSDIDGEDAEQKVLREGVAAVLGLAVAASGVVASLHLHWSGRGDEGEGEDAEDGLGKHVD